MTSGETGSSAEDEKKAKANIGTSDGTKDKQDEREEEVPMTFPQRLMEMLEDEANQEMIHWLPHGKGFVIADKKRFAAEVLPRYFSRKSKFTSFTRKLNRWNFTRVTRGPETGAYYHQYFQKGNHRLALQMSCIHSRAPQQIQPMNPIALGLGVNQDMSQYPQWMLFQQHQLMAMAAMNQQPQQSNQNSSTSPSEPKTDGAAQEMTPLNPAAMMAFQQQQQQFAMMMAAQQQQQQQQQLAQSPAATSTQQPNQRSPNPSSSDEAKRGDADQGVNSGEASDKKN